MAAAILPETDYGGVTAHDQISEFHSGKSILRLYSEHLYISFLLSTLVCPFFSHLTSLVLL